MVRLVRVRSTCWMCPIFSSVRVENVGPVPTQRPSPSLGPSWRHSDSSTSSCHQQTGGREQRQHYTQPVCSAVMSGQAGEDDIAGVNGPGKCNVHSILRRIYFRQRYMASCCRMTVSLLAPWPPQEVVQVNTRTVPNSTGAPSSPGTDI